MVQEGIFNETFDPGHFMVNKVQLLSGGPTFFHQHFIIHSNSVTVIVHWAFPWGQYKYLSELHMQIFGIMKCRFKIIATNQEAILNKLGNKNTRMVICVDSCMNQMKKMLQKPTQLNILQYFTSHQPCFPSSLSSLLTCKFYCNNINIIIIFLKMCLISRQIKFGQEKNTGASPQRNKIFSKVHQLFNLRRRKKSCLTKLC